jgi:hypothetical protein
MARNKIKDVARIRVMKHSMSDSVINLFKGVGLFIHVVAYDNTCVRSEIIDSRMDCRAEDDHPG